MGYFNVKLIVGSNPITRVIGCRPTGKAISYFLFPLIYLCNNKVERGAD